MPRTRTKRKGIKLYSSDMGVTALGIKDRTSNKHKSKFKINGKRKISKEMAEQALGNILAKNKYDLQE